MKKLRLTGISIKTKEVVSSGKKRLNDSPVSVYPVCHSVLTAAESLSIALAVKPIAAELSPAEISGNQN